MHGRLTRKCTGDRPGNAQEGERELREWKGGGRGAGGEDSSWTCAGAGFAACATETREGRGRGWDRELAWEKQAPGLEVEKIAQ
eukprot:4505120-Pleurochrysis_carterae.AAC.1